jgi:hypothetical protein
MGRQSLYNNTTASNNVAIGEQTLAANTTGARNTAVGGLSLDANTTGSENVAIGYKALGASTTASSNVAIGVEALQTSTSGEGNIAIGLGALKVSTNGSSSVAVGRYALLSCTTGSQNVAIGNEAGRNVTTTSLQNTLVGTSAGIDITSASNYNTCIGNNSGNNITNGASHNIFIGHSSTTYSGGSDRQICIGTDVSSVGHDYITFGRDSVGRVYNEYSSNASWTRTSDVRLKKDIQDNTDLGLDFVNDLRTVTYKWKAPSEQPTNFLSYDADITEPAYTNKMYGFIAQEVKAVLDDHNVTDFNGWTQTEGNGDVQGISYEMFVMPLVKAIQELSAKNDALEARIATLEG